MDAITVAADLPHVFKEKYPSTHATIDGAEIFLETPSDSQMQSSTWIEYKHHNTSKSLTGCTLNGALCYVITSVCRVYFRRRTY